MIGFDCPDDSYQHSARLHCPFTDFKKTRSANSQAKCSGNGKMAWIGELCEDLTWNDWFITNSDEMAWT